MVIFDDAAGKPCGMAALAEVGSGSGTALLDMVALPDPHSVSVVRLLAHESVSAAFQGAPIRHIYFERFDDDPDLISEMTCWTHEVTLPEFAMVDGRYSDRLTFGVSRAEFERWEAGQPEMGTS